jgi:general secretion pathway protein C
LQPFDQSLLLPGRIVQAGEAIGWAIAGLLLARAMWLAVAPAGPLGNPLAPATAPPVLAAIDPFFPAGEGGGDAVSALDLVLVGTRVDAASGRGAAIIATPDGQQGSFAVGDEVMPGVRLAGVTFESVLLARGGRRETLYIDQSAAP